MSNLGVLRAEKEWPFCFELTSVLNRGRLFLCDDNYVKVQAMRYYSISTKSSVENDKLFNLNLKIFDEA